MWLPKAREETNDSAGLQLRMDAMVEQVRLENSGVGNELMKMQQVLWPVERLMAQDFVIDMLFDVVPE